MLWYLKTIRILHHELLLLLGGYLWRLLQTDAGTIIVIRYYNCLDRPKDLITNPGHNGLRAGTLSARS